MAFQPPGGARLELTEPVPEQEGQGPNLGISTSSLHNLQHPGSLAVPNRGDSFAIRLSHFPNSAVNLFTITFLRGSGHLGLNGKLDSASKRDSRHSSHPRQSSGSTSLPWADSFSIFFLCGQRWCLGPQGKVSHLSTSHPGN